MRSDMLLGEPDVRAWRSAYRQAKWSFVALLVLLTLMWADVDLPGWLIVGFAALYLGGLWRLGRRAQEFLS